MTDATKTPKVFVQLLTPLGDSAMDDTNDSVKVTISSGGFDGVVTNAGTFATQVDGDALTALQLIDNTVAVLGTATYSEATTSGNVIGVVRNDALATLAGTDNEIAPLQVDVAGALFVTTVSNTTHGHAAYTNVDTSALATIKASAGTMYWFHATSIDETVAFVSFYDATSPTLGSSPKLMFPIPTQGDAQGAGLTINFGPHGIKFTNSIKIGAATTVTGSTDPGTNVVVTNVGFE